MLLVRQQERQPASKQLSGWMLAWLCLGKGADLHMAQLMPLPLTISCSSKSGLVLPSWFYLSGAQNLGHHFRGKYLIPGVGITEFPYAQCMIRHKMQNSLIHPAFLIKHWLVTDRQTDRQTDRHTRA